MKINDILKGTAYSLQTFQESQIQALEKSIITKSNKKGVNEFFVPCMVREKEIKLTPEEVIRQLYIGLLHKEYGYPIERMQLEYPVKFGREEKRADIVIFDAENATQPYIVVEVKQPQSTNGQKADGKLLQSHRSKYWRALQWARYRRILYEQRGQKIKSNNP